MKALFSVLALVLSASAFAADCPVQVGTDGYLEKVGAAIKATKSCTEASEVAEACALGASGDVYTVPFAERKCGLDFWNKLSVSEKKIYNGLQAKCDAKYAKMEGTMYLSFTAFCKLSVAKLYSELYTPAE